MSFAASMAVALALDAALGWPGPVYRRIGHPVTWIGALIAGLERRWNHGTPARRRLAGAALTGLCTGLAGGLAWLLTTAIPAGWAGVLVTGALAWPLVATRALHDHVRAVQIPLAAGDLPAARAAVAMIVGRDPAALDAPGIARASVESLAENTSDGIVAPIFWGVLLGLPGIAAYKAINTLDSMIGHRNDRYLDFGRAAARLDDAVNLLPARLTGALFALCSRRPGAALRSMARDARHHRSPNAGWPEAAMAGALHIRLSGPRLYGGTPTDDPFVNAAAPDPRAGEIGAGLALYRRSMVCLLALCLLVALVRI